MWHDVALMGTGTWHCSALTAGTDGHYRWHFWGHTDQGTLIIIALMRLSSPLELSARQLMRREMLITGISLFTCDQ
ncbi:unnamed protein product, partial [Staurois parvus]